MTMQLATSKALRSLIERIERLTEQKAAIADDIRDVYADAKSRGFDVAAMRDVIKRRSKDPEERKAHDDVVETYMVALGMLEGTPLGSWAVANEDRAQA